MGPSPRGDQKGFVVPVSRGAETGVTWLGIRIEVVFGASGATGFGISFGGSEGVAGMAGAPGAAGKAHPDGAP